MSKEKLLKVIEPEFERDLYTLMFDYGDGVIQKVYMNKYEYKVYIAKQALINSGVEEKLIQDFELAIESNSDRYL